MVEIFLKPRSGLKVRDPKTHRPLPPEGMKVRKSVYWMRRLRDRDVEIIKPIPLNPHTESVISLKRLERPLKKEKES
ncbi:MAG: DUF2635 domain-containing protein [Deltaproteobacteria bacterium]|nr:DUF2635 domain-containing protein [Deltaproteobacteria bacterium]